jgi:hypothetical protein
MLMYFRILSKKFFLLLFTAIAPISLLAQTPNLSETGGKAGAAPVTDLTMYDPVAVQDVRFIVNNLNFSRRFDANGLGEFLDVNFDLINNTAEKLNFRVYVLAFYESTASEINKGGRRFVPLPEWRSNDPDAKHFVTYLMAITPEDIAETTIWNENDPDYIQYSKIANRIKNSAATTGIVGESLPPFWKYLSYIQSNPEKGLPISLYGMDGPKPEESLFTNYIPPTPEEKKNRMHKTLIQHKYTVFYQGRKTMFQSHHYARFRPSYNFFNRVAILIFDDAKIQSKSSESLVYKRTYVLPENLKH